MICAKVREMLKADYLDAEIASVKAREIFKHLKGCPGCRAMEEELRGQSAVFKGAARKQVPEHLWQNIRESIASSGLDEERSLIRGFTERLRGLFLRPRPAFALAGALSVAVLVVFLAGSIIQKKQYLDQEAGEAAIALYSLNGDSSEPVDGLGTNIEEYFL